MGIVHCVYVLSENGGYEGHRAPAQAALTLAEARGLARVMRAAGRNIEIFAVPVWPNTDGEEFRKPIALNEPLAGAA